MTDETQPLILPSDRRAKLVSGFQAAFCSTPERFSLHPAAPKSAATIPITREGMFWPPPSTWIPSPL